MIYLQSYAMFFIHHDIQHFFVIWETFFSKFKIQEYIRLGINLNTINHWNFPGYHKNWGKSILALRHLTIFSKLDLSHLTEIFQLGKLRL